ncbi:MAG TPA: hemin uptake protein HemP [Burkholderiales bacterium]|nr:hemin uptake protein HemP [Burkholderiales bacterium]
MSKIPGIGEETLAAPAANVVRTAAPAGRRQLPSRELLGGGNELHIEHNGEIYTLRQTRQGKLILTK